VKLVVVAAYPPKPRLYFYDPSGPVKEPLFKAMMKAINFKPTTKEDGLREFQRRGWLLVDATYRPLDGLSEEAREKVILQSYPALLAELAKVLPDKSTPILVKANVRRVLGPRLTKAGFTVLNGVEVAGL
jgi:hypothetical protein